MTFKNPLGVYPSLEAVWKAYPSGGTEGDYVIIEGRLYGWDVAANDWVTPNNATTPSSRKTKVIEGDLNVHNDITVGGILKARLVRGRSAFVGLYESAEALNTYYPRPVIGQWALVIIADRTNMAIGEVYICKQDGVWLDAGYQGSFDGDIDALQTEIENRIEDVALHDYPVITDEEMDEVLTLE